MVVAIVMREIVISVVVFFFVFLSFSFCSGREGDFLFFLFLLERDWNFTYLDINAPTRAETSNCDHMVLFFLFGGIEFAA